MNAANTSATIAGVYFRCCCSQSAQSTHATMTASLCAFAADSKSSSGFQAMNTQPFRAFCGRQSRRIRYASEAQASSDAAATTLTVRMGASRLSRAMA